MSTEAQTLELMNDIEPASFLPAAGEQPEFEFFTVNTVGVTIKEEMPETEWIDGTASIVRAYGAAEESHIKMAFRIGDWLNFGEAKYGERWAQACTDEMEKTIGKKKIGRCMWVAKAIPIELRDLSLRWEHHEKVAVCSPDEIKTLFQKVKNEGLNTTELGEEVKLLHPPKNTTPKEAAKQAKKKAALAAPKITEEDAIKAAELLANYFDQAEEADGPLSKWDADRVTRLNNVMHPLEMCAKRLRNAAKKNKAAK